LLQAVTYVKQRAFLLGWSLWIALIAEFLSRGALGDTLVWSVTSIHLWLLNGLVILGLLLILLAATGSAKIAYWIVTAATLAFAFVSGVKLRLKGLPLLPWDLGLAREATDVIAWKDVFSVPVLIGIAIFIGGSVLLVHRLVKPHGKLGWKEKAALAAAALCLVGGTYAIPGLARPFDQVENVQHNGYLLATLWNLRYVSTGGLPNQPHEDVAAILDLSGKTEIGGVDKDAKPNVIVVLSESLFDPTTMKGVTFNQDPMPFYHSLQQRYPSGNMLSPEFAGSTANVELEVLTGLSMKFLPDGVVAYEKYINRPVDSLASILARQGYASTMITPWSHWFFNSETAYKNMGFGRLISGEFLIQTFDGPYMADSEVARAIMDESEKSPGPDFIFANTAQNHYGYWPGKFKQEWISVSGPLSEESMGILQSYAQGCAYADKMLQTLVEHYSASKEPTIVVFFGDHLPLLGPKYQVYKEAGYITGENDPDFLNKIYRVPVLVWNNYLPEHTDHISFGANFLAPYVLNEARRPPRPIWTSCGNR
jgi:phosphoglycerol transferase MdoB-like AlkP superfamily enzyme